MNSDTALVGFRVLFEVDLPRERWARAAHIATGTAYTLRHGNGGLAPTRSDIQRTVPAWALLPRHITRR
jgi:hypothetical protein